MKAYFKKALKYLAIAMIVAGCVYILKPGFSKYAEHRADARKLEAEVERLEAERVMLEEKMQKLEDEDPELIEKLAREKLHLSKPDETVFKFKKKE